MSETAVEPGALPAGLAYRLLLPEQWVKLPADPTAMRAAARRHLEHRFADLPRDRTAQLRRSLEDDLVRLADAAGSAYAVDILLLSLDVAERPVSASCLVSLVPIPLADAAALGTLAAELGDGALTSEVVDLGPHRVVRVTRDEQPAAEGPAVVADWDGRSRLVDVYVPVPDSEATLLLSFATPVVPLFDVLTELFDAMVSTLQWTAEGAPWR